MQSSHVIWIVGTPGAPGWSWIEPSNSARPTRASPNGPCQYSSSADLEMGAPLTAPHLLSFSDSPCSLGYSFGKPLTWPPLSSECRRPRLGAQHCTPDGCRGHIPQILAFPWGCLTSGHCLPSQPTGSYLVGSDLKNLAITAFGQSLFYKNDINMYVCIYL